MNLHDILKTPHVYVEAETSNAVAPRIVQIAILDAHGTPLLYTKVRQASISPEASAVHGFTAENLQDAPTWRDVLPKVRRLTEGRRALVYSADFLNKALFFSCRDVKEPILRLPAVCVMAMFAEFNGEWSKYRKAYTFKKLAFAAHSFGYTNPQPNDALQDALAVRAVAMGLASVGG